MIYVDPPFALESQNPQAKAVGRRHGHRWCHMWADVGEVEQLHAMAARIGLKREWFQDKPKFPHYDLVPSKRALAIKYGAVAMPLREWIQTKREGGGHE